MSPELYQKLKKQFGDLDAPPLNNVFNKYNVDNFNLTNGVDGFISIPFSSVKDIEGLNRDLAKIRTDSGREFKASLKDQMYIIPSENYRKDYSVSHRDRFTFKCKKRHEINTTLEPNIISFKRNY